MSVRPATKRLLRHLVDQLDDDSPVVVIDDWHAALTELGLAATTGRLAIAQLIEASAIHHVDPMVGGRPKGGRPRRRVIVLNTANPLVLDQLIGQPEDYDAVLASCTGERDCPSCFKRGRPTCQFGATR